LVALLLKKLVSKKKKKNLKSWNQLKCMIFILMKNRFARSVRLPEYACMFYEFNPRPAVEYWWKP
jgi:hypothetical protein